MADPFTTPYPSVVQTSLVSGASFARFDPSGRFVAGGRPDGAVAIWDLDTSSTVRWLEGHVKGVTSIDWSRHSRYVLTSSKDWNVIAWDLSSDPEPVTRRQTIRFDSPIVSAQFHPRNSLIVLVLLNTGDLYLVDSRKNHKSRSLLYEDTEGGDDDDDVSGSRITVARFDPTGRHIFAGTSAGSLLVFNARTKTMAGRHRILGAGLMRGLEFSRSGRRLLTNSSDRIIRQFNVPYYYPPHACLEHDLEPISKFSDPISKAAWYAMAYSPHDEWVIGGAADTATHKIYVWDVANDGQFVTALDGGREPLIDVHWHPSKSSMASTTVQGNILIWHVPSPEKWGAFAGGFEEVDENVEYQEQEDEFDIEDEKVLINRKMKEEEVEVDIDIDGQSERTPKDDGVRDVDALWADEDPDDDFEGWMFKTAIEDDGDQAY